MTSPTWLCSIRLYSILFSIVMLATPRAASPQADTLKNTRVDFAVPDAPAFKVLDIEPGTVLRPGSAREVAVSVANFITNGAVLPTGFAVEFAPVLIFGKSLQAYRENPFVHRIRVSVATKADKELGAGLRFTLVDAADLRTEAALTAQLISIGNQTNRLNAECVSELASRGITPDSALFQKELTDCLEKKSVKVLSDSIALLRERTKQEKWNAPLVEVALALGARAPDSLARNLSAANYAAWVSGAWPLGKDGQLLLGLRASLLRDEAGDFNLGEGTFGARAYYGGNSQKAFLETEAVFKTATTTIFGARVGYEFNLFNGFWVDLAVGLKHRDGFSEATSRFTLKVATPE